ncbi:MAG TPA: ABC transporter ATP-binding protein [Candidatus Dormibacteraeota bacterium]|nr:ABC transporter ATP-binding protein [Candidatus Dormibacteraeota bacterium]
MIEVRDVALEIAGRRLLSDISLSVASGELVAIVGPNGVGKTTLLRAIAGFHPPALGTIAIDGVRIDALSTRERALRIAFLAAEETPVEALRVRDVVAAGRYPHHRWWEWRENAADEAAIATALAEVRAQGFADRTFSTLSSGERRNVWVAVALAQETPVLLLDEPTTHLDLHVAQRMLALLRSLARRGKAILCALHDLNEAAAYADRIVLFGDGALRAAGAPDDVLASPLLDVVYESTIARVRLADGHLRVYPSGAPPAPER